MAAAPTPTPTAPTSRQRLPRHATPPLRRTPVPGRPRRPEPSREPGVDACRRLHAAHRRGNAGKIRPARASEYPAISVRSAAPPRSRSWTAVWAATSTAGDSTFSSATVDGTTTPGSKSMPCSVSDAQARSGSPPCPWRSRSPSADPRYPGRGAHLALAGQIVSTNGIVTARCGQRVLVAGPVTGRERRDVRRHLRLHLDRSDRRRRRSVHVNGAVRSSGRAGLEREPVHHRDRLADRLRRLAPATHCRRRSRRHRRPRCRPAKVIEDDASGNVETSGVFDPANDGIDFWESLEGMRVQLNDAGRRRPDERLRRDAGRGRQRRQRRAAHRRAAASSSGRPTSTRSGSSSTTDPRRRLPAVDVGDHFAGAMVGVLDYNFGNFKLEVTTAAARRPGGVTRETTTAPGRATSSRSATFNVENLDPSDPQRSSTRSPA